MISREKQHKNRALFYFLILSVVLTISGCKPNQSNETISKLSEIPKANVVGAKVLPDEIKPVSAPFPTIKFVKPNFRKDTVLLSLSTKSINTESIQKSIDELSNKGGGVIQVPDGQWLTGRIQLKDNINLHIPENAVLIFSGEIIDFLPAVFTRYAGVEIMSLAACIYANGATNIAITGAGLLIGPGESPVRDQVSCEEPAQILDANTPVAERIYDGIKDPHIFRPMFISPINCTNVYIEGISLEKTAFWNIVPIYCDKVIIRGITINSVGIPMGDGIDIESSTNVLIEYCTLSCGDDSFTMKSGRGKDGLRVNKPTENVVVRYCLTKKGHGGITCGSETAGMIRNLYVHDCVFLNTLFAIRFKTRRPRGGGGENLYFERIRINAEKEAFAWDMLGNPNWVGELADRLPVRVVNELTPKYHNIYAKDIIVENSRYFIKAHGIPESPLNNVTIENVIVKCSNIFDLRDMQNSTFSNIQITSTDTDMTILDSKNLHFNNIEFISFHELDLQITGEKSDSITFNSCTNFEDYEFFANK